MGDSERNAYLAQQQQLARFESRPRLDAIDIDAAGQFPARRIAPVPAQCVRARLPMTVDQGVDFLPSKVEDVQIDDGRGRQIEAYDGLTVERIGIVLCQSDIIRNSFLAYFLDNRLMGKGPGINQ